MDNKDDKYKCIIVEDEPIAADIIENFIIQDKDFQLIAKCSDAVYATSLLSLNKIDLMFLDLHLPVIKGFDFIKKIKNPPFIIVTTAYHQYALEGYELNIVDYLVKPFSYSRFMSAVEKFKYLIKSEEALLQITDRDYIFINISKKQIKIYLQDIIYIESLKEYIKIHTEKETYLVKMPISKIENSLNKDQFARIHKSYIVAKSRIEMKSANEVVINGKKFPVGRTYKQFIGHL